MVDEIKKEKICRATAWCKVRGVYLRRPFPCDTLNSYSFGWLWSFVWKWRALSIALLVTPGVALPEHLVYQLATRYAPYADSDSIFDIELLAKRDPDPWWSSPEDIRAQRSEDSLPLEGLHLAIDPGHIGGRWAEWEGRNFRIHEKDHWIREGELVLEVAELVSIQLTELGAEVTLLRVSNRPINPKSPIDYIQQAGAELGHPDQMNLIAKIEHALDIRDRAVRLAVVVGEIAERARVVNQVIRPDALISLHINAAPWPAGDQLKLVQGNHAHVLIFGCLSQHELSSLRQQEQLIEKLTNGSGSIELQLGRSLGKALAEASELPASEYEGKNAIRIDSEVPYLWARNLMLLRLVDCPTVLLEPYIANSVNAYARLQDALESRANGELPKEDDILVEYADAVVAGVLDTYGQK